MSLKQVITKQFKFSVWKILTTEKSWIFLSTVQGFITYFQSKTTPKGIQGMKKSKTSFCLTLIDILAGAGKLRAQNTRP